MNKSISLTFGEPEHGWLPVNFTYQDFHLEFYASDVLNDSIEELFNASFPFNSSDPNSVTWWLEPEASIFEIKREESKFSLTIFETENLHNGNAPKRQIIKIIAMKNADLVLRDRLVQDGKLSEGYDEDMNALHNTNAAKLSAIIDSIGYPTEDKARNRNI